MVLTLLEASLKLVQFGGCQFYNRSQMNPGDRINPCVGENEKMHRSSITGRVLRLLDGCKGYFGSQHRTYFSCHGHDSGEIVNNLSTQL